MTFPQYRKLQNRAYYKVVSETELFEMQRLGQRFVPNHLVANTFVDRNLITDILEGDNGRYEVISEEEFEAVAKKQ